MAEELARLAAEAMGFGGHLVEVYLRDGPVFLVVEIDEREHARRRSANLKGIVDRQVVTALWELPHGVALERALAPAWILESMADAPAGIVEQREATVRSLAVQPARITGAIAVGQRVSQGLLGRVGQVSALAPMAIVSRRRCAPTNPVLLDAHLFGIGMCVEIEGGLDVVLRAEPVHPTAGPFLWWVTELAYDGLADQLTREATMP